MRFLLRLYPRSWQDRYEEEFEALLEQRRFRIIDVLDIARGALDAQLRTYKRRESMHDGTTRLAGLSLLLASTLWILGIIDRYGYDFGWYSGVYPIASWIGSDTLRGYIPLLLLFGLSGLRHCVLQSGVASRSLSITLAGMQLGLALYTGTWAAERFLGLRWYSSALEHGVVALGMGGLCLALPVAAITLVRGRIVPRWGIIPLAVGLLAIPAFIVAVLLLDATTAHRLIYHGQVYAGLAFGLGWIPLGIALLARGTRNDGRQTA